MLLDVGWAPFLNVTHIGADEDTPRFPVFARAASMAEAGIEQSGYIDIKQPPKAKGRKLKSWKKKWVVLHEMSIRAAGRAAAKVDVYADEKTAATSPSDKHTFILEYVTNIRAAKSKTHAHAFEIVENEAVLLLAGHSELESQTWISAFRNIFWPQEIENHVYNVSIVQNEHTKRLSLEGAYVMTITPEVIGIESDSHNSYEWSLSMLKRFNHIPDPENSGKDLLVIECGPKSECGEATFLFRSDDVIHVLASIKKNIYTAINMKKCSNTSPAGLPHLDKPWRNSAVSATSSEEKERCDTVSSSEQRYRDLLDPPMPESKRTRLMSTGSELSSAGSDKTSIHSNLESARLPATTEEAPAVPVKKRHSVTFETPQEISKKDSSHDILSQPIQHSDKEEDDCEYNRVLFNPPKDTQTNNNIITMFTIADQGYQTKVLLDDRGYSHVSFKDKKPVVDDDKTRSLSNISSHSSSFSMRSASVGSRDSGIQYQAADNTEQLQRGAVSSRSTNSFDSAVSTSSATETNDTVTVDSNPMNLKVEIHELEVDESGKIINKESEESSIYQDVVIDDDNAGVSECAKAKLVLKKSNSAGEFRKEENEYEDLEKYQKGRKDIWKHLGIDPKVDPTSIPPALPERPLSQKMKRKFLNQDRKQFTLPFMKNKPKKSKEVAMSVTSSSSDSDTESVKANMNNGDITIKKWPLGNKSVIAGNDDLYQPVAIERFLKDGDSNVVQMRERSSSLNLNMSSSFQRASKKYDKEKRAAEKKTAMWKHNRNASMNVEVLQRMNAPNTADSVVKKKCEMALQNEPLGESIFESSLEGMGFDAENRTLSNSDTSSLVSEDEPIYAEVGPSSRSRDGVAEDPFPDIAPWQAHEDHSGFLDRTLYENDESVNTSKDNNDVLNQCFVSKGEQPKPNKSESLLIDLSDPVSESNVTSASDVKNASTAVDIFSLEFDPMFTEPKPSAPANNNNVVDIFHLGMFSQPLMPQRVEPEMTSPVSSQPELEMSGITEEDSIYMDMTTIKNESIYVMPSTLKQ